MAKTIKQMAHEHVVAYMHNDDYEEMEDTYIAGANAMLDIIEECLEEPSMIQGYSNIMAVVQELKGE